MKKHTPEEIAKLIMEEIKTKPGLSFVEMEELFKSVGFDYRELYKDNPDGKTGTIEGMRILPYENLYVWAGWNKTAREAINYLMQHGYHYQQVPAWVYIVDGCILNNNLFQVAKGLKSYKKPHWLPAVICKD